MASGTLGGMPDSILDYADTAETNAMRDDMRRVNAWLERASITFVDDGAEPVDIHDRTLRRLFVIHKGDPGATLRSQRATVRWILAGLATKQASGDQDQR